MGESIAAEIYIGGDLKSHLVAGLIAAINADGAGQDWDIHEEFETLDDLRACLEDDELHLMDSQARYGTFENIETFCLENGLYFQRHSDAKYEYDAEWVVLAPGMKKPKHFHAQQDGGIVVQSSVVEPIRVKLERLHNSIAAQIRKKKKVDPAATQRCLRHLIDVLKRAIELPEIPDLTLPENANE